MDDIERPPLYLADGTLHKGPVFESDKGKPYCEVTLACTKCGGSGKWRRGRRFGACFRCDGEGETFDQAKLLTAKELATKQARKAKQVEKAIEEQRRKEADRVERYECFVLDNADLMARALVCEDPFVKDLCEKAVEWGGMTERQLEALKITLDRIDEDMAAMGNSQPVGEIGQRLDVVVTCRRQGSFMGKKFKGRGREQVFVTDMVDDEGNAFVTITANFTLDAGNRVLLRGTVKEHDGERKPWVRTVLTRAVPLERLPPVQIAEDADALSDDSEMEHAPGM